jgi:hypothetical protein
MKNKDQQPKNRSIYSQMIERMSRQHHKWTAEEIKTFYLSKEKAFQVTNDGAITYDSKISEHYDLINHGAHFPTFDFSALITAVCYLTKFSIREHGNTFITHDLRHTWAWCAELLLSYTDEHWDILKREPIRELLKLATYAALSNGKGVLSGQENQDHAHFENNLLNEKDTILDYLAFPLIESVTKLACREYIAHNGSIIKNIKIRHPTNNKIINLKAPDYCSSIKNLLHLMYETCNSPTLRESIDKITECIKTAHGEHPFDQIFRWRNGALHGEMEPKAAGSLLLSMSLLILLHEIENDFESIRKAVHFKWEYQNIRGDNKPFNFYPPDPGEYWYR